MVRNLIKEETKMSTEIVPATDITGIEQMFNYEGKPLRTLKDEKGSSWFCLPDVIDILGMTQLRPESLMADGVITTQAIDKLGRSQNTRFIDEANLYKIAFQSRKKSAEDFTNHVARVILPTIRQTGMYVANPNMSAIDVCKAMITAIEEQSTRVT
jgi:prophage antirepressor-like protein